MSVTILDLRIAILGVAATNIAIVGKASGQFAGIASPVGYETLFDNALHFTAGLQTPWIAKSPRASRFWKKYVTERLETGDEPAWPGIARSALVPIRLDVPLPRLALHTGTRRSFAEAYGWATGVGVNWNAWIEGPISIDELVAVIDQIRSGSIPLVDPDGTKHSLRWPALTNSALDAVGTAAFGPGPDGLRSDPMLVVSIVRASNDGGDDDVVKAARDALLSGIEDSFGERPSIPEGDRGTGGDSIYVGRRVRLVWLPKSFLKERRIHRIGCLHRNLLQSSLQTEMIGTATRMLAEAARDGLPAAYRSHVDSVIEQSDAVIGGGGYSAPFLIEQLMRGPVVAARKALQA